MSKIKSPAANEFLKKFQNVVDKTDELSAICQCHNNTGQLRSLAKELETMPEEELKATHDVLKDVGGWNQLSDDITDVIKKVKTAESLELTRSGEVTIASTDCQLGHCPGPSQSDVHKWFSAVATAEKAAAAAQIAADKLATAGWFGERAAKIAQVVASVLKYTAKVIAYKAQQQQKLLDIKIECEHREVRKILVNMCNTINTMNEKVDQVINKLVEINKKLDDLLKIAGETKAVVDEILLHQIEDALSNCQMLVNLYLPDYAKGSISKVQSIIEKLITFSKISGLTVANAESYWRQGSIALSNKQYEKAMQWFMLSYKQLQTKDVCAVPCPSEPCK